MIDLNKALCELLGEAMNVILKETIKELGPIGASFLYTLLGGKRKKDCVDLDVVAPGEELRMLSQEEFGRIMPIFANVFYVKIYELLGEEGAYAFIKSFAQILLRYYGKYALEALERLTSLGEHAPKIEVERDGDVIKVKLRMRTEFVEEALKTGAQRGSMLTMLAALILAKDRDVVFVERKRLDKNTLEYVYKIV